MFLESLGAVQADAGEYPEALRSVDRALKMDNSPQVRFRLTLEKLGLLRVTGDKSAAVSLLGIATGQSPDPDQARLLEALRLALFPPTPTPVRSPGRPAGK